MEAEFKLFSVLILVSSFCLISGQVNFGNIKSQRKTPNCAAGRNGQVIVHLFSWRWNDIAAECENVLGPKGFCGVQVSPPNEHRIVTSPNRPWWERYQPVSYKLDSASGSRSEFIKMVERCDAVGVKVYIDAVINHMAGADAGSGRGSGGSFYDTKQKKFDGVPFGPNDFGNGCTTASGNIENYNDAEQVRNCALLSLLELKVGSSYVRRKIADYFDDMLSIGIDGYRIDAAKHMWPGDLDTIVGMAKLTKSGQVPFVYQEVIGLSDAEAVKTSEYVDIGRITEFKYGAQMARIFMKNEVALTHLKTFGSSWGLLSDDDAFVFVDNHDNQRGHGAGGNVVTFKKSYALKLAVVFMLSWPYGVPRIMSSYDFNEDWEGPPSGSPGTSGNCMNGWICEHRWRQITNMVAWRNTAGNARVENWWSNGNNQIAYSRGASSFIAFNKNDGNMNSNIKTGLPAGQYCDIISGDIKDGQCTGKTITVNVDSTAQIQIDGGAEEPFIAFHLGSKIGGSGVIPSTPLPGVSSPSFTSSPSQPTGVQRTIVFLKKRTNPGEDVFLRGGCGPSCTIPITYPSPRLGSAFEAYNKWSQGDTELDWNGKESGQTRVKGEEAQGSPMAWTDSRRSASEFVPENTYGDHYWMWDVLMDCSKTTGGYFEIKGYLNGYEKDIQQKKCTGDTSSVLLHSQNHVAKCGYKNVFTWNTDSCIMEQLG